MRSAELKVWLAQQYFQPMAWWVLGFMVLYLTALGFWVFRKNGRSIYKHLERLPLDSGDSP